MTLKAVAKFGILFLFLIAVFPLTMASLDWETFGRDNSNSFSQPGAFFSTNYSKVASVAQGTASYNTPIVYDLDGDGLKEIAFLSNNFLRIYTSSLLSLADASIPYSYGNQIALTPTTTSNCNTAQEHGMAFITNPDVNTTDVTFQVWCWNGTSLYRHDNIVIWPSDTYVVNSTYKADNGSGVACDDVVESCIFKSFRNDSIADVWVCNMNGITCTSENSASVADSAYLYWNPTYSDIDKSDCPSCPEAVFLADTNSSDSYVGLRVTHFNLSADTGLVFLNGEIGIYNPSKPFATVIDRGASNNYIAFYEDEYVLIDTDKNNNFKAFDITGSQVWSSEDCYAHYGVSPSSNLCTFSNLIKTNAGQYCYFWTFYSTWDNTHDYTAYCIDTEGTVQTQGDFAFLWGNVTFTGLPYLHATGADLNNNGLTDMILGRFAIDLNTYSLVARGNISAFALGDRYVLPVDSDGNGNIELLATTTGSTQIFQAFGNPPSPYICIDTDRATYPTINYTLKGKATYLTSTGTDFCTGTQLTEFYCQNANTFTWSTVSCTFGCINGKCLTCLEIWNCTGYGDCAGAYRNRTCVDTNTCGTSFFKPATTEACPGISTVTTIDLPGSLIDQDKLNNPTAMINGFLPQLFYGILAFLQVTIVPIAFILMAVLVLMIGLLVLKKATG